MHGHGALASSLGFIEKRGFAVLVNDRISISPVTGSLGAVIEGVDLAKDSDAATTKLIRNALLEHGVIFFHDQKMTPAEHVEAGRRFGTLNIHQYVRPLEDYPEIIVIAKDEDDTKNFGGIWHSDTTFLEEPALGSILYCLECPDHGGDTMFANQYDAYERLSPGMKRMLDGMVAIHTPRRSYTTEAVQSKNLTNKAMKFFEDTVADQETEHPVVRMHPETGRKCLYVNEDFTSRFKDMTVEESAPLLNYLAHHSTRPEFVCRFRWKPGSVAFWDNRAVQHYAINDYNGQRRVMHRVTINGDRPR
ncbi:MAG: TauD/TfdA family dioxygenase [Proteobacteria bacterium]|nr:TauD/TfdA family dioxygenase [Pseudomonadota bacterium]